MDFNRFIVNLLEVKTKACRDTSRQAFIVLSFADDQRLGLSHLWEVVQLSASCWSPTLMWKSPASSTHLLSGPTKARSAPFSLRVSVLVSPGASSTLSKARRRRTSGVSEATRSLLNNNTLSFPATLPVLLTSTENSRMSPAVKVFWLTFKLL